MNHKECNAFLQKHKTQAERYQQAKKHAYAENAKNYAAAVLKLRETLAFQGKKILLELLDMETGNTALHNACELGVSDSTLHILEHTNITLLTPNTFGLTPFWLSMLSRPRFIPELLRYLQQHGEIRSFFFCIHIHEKVYSST